MRSVKYFINNPRDITQGLVRKCFANIINDDRRYLSLLYFATFWKRMHWDKPETFNEKMTWLKVYGYEPKYAIMADKYAVKKYVADRIGDKYVVENYTVADTWDEIDFNNIPNSFVIKCTHDSGGAFVCRDKTTFDFDEIKKKVEWNLNNNDYRQERERPYKDIKPRIIVDRLLDDHTGKELRDYKFWCFNGTPTYMYCTIKAAHVYENFYDMEFNPIPIDHGFPRHSPEFEKPQCFEEMKELAAKLSKDIPFVRVDFFQVDGKVYFGEFTFFDWGGLLPFKKGWDKKIGDLITLPKK